MASTEEDASEGDAKEEEPAAAVEEPLPESEEEEFVLPKPEETKAPVETTAETEEAEQ